MLIDFIPEIIFVSSLYKKIYKKTPQIETIDTIEECFAVHDQRRINEIDNASIITDINDCEFQNGCIYDETYNEWQELQNHNKSCSSNITLSTDNTLCKQNENDENNL